MAVTVSAEGALVRQNDLAGHAEGGGHSDMMWRSEAASSVAPTMSRGRGGGRAFGVAGMKPGRAGGDQARKRRGPPFRRRGGKDCSRATAQCSAGAVTLQERSEVDRVLLWHRRRRFWESIPCRYPRGRGGQRRPGRARSPGLEAILLTGTLRRQGRHPRCVPIPLRRRAMWVADGVGDAGGIRDRCHDGLFAF